MKDGITLFLQSFKGLTSLKAVIEAKHSNLVKSVVIGSDKNVANDYSEDIGLLCKSSGIKFSSREVFDYKNIGSISIAVSWNRMLETRNTKLIVLHDSLLPKYRGFAPLVCQLLNREPNVGVTAFFATDEYDRGDIIFQDVIPIRYPIKIKDAIRIVSESYKTLILNIFQILDRGGQFETAKQDESKATYSLWRNYDDYFIDWSLDSNYISRFIDSVGEPYFGAQTFINDNQVTILDAVPFEDMIVENRDSGKIIFSHDSFPVIVCGKGLLKITNAIYNKDGKSIFPLKEFRIRFRDRKE